MKFVHSRKKVERAMKHINDLNQLLIDFSASEFYSVRVQEHEGSNCVLVIFVKQFSTTEAALIVGDTLHNLRSALDLMYYRVFHDVTGKADRFTQFPIRKERKKLISAINGGLEEKGLADDRNAVPTIVSSNEPGKGHRTLKQHLEFRVGRDGESTTEMHRSFGPQKNAGLRMTSELQQRGRSGSLRLTLQRAFESLIESGFRFVVFRL